jgi:hypothetical protein
MSSMESTREPRAHAWRHRTAPGGVLAGSRTFQVRHAGCVLAWHAPALASRTRGALG